MRANGLAVLVGIVALGLGSGAAYFHYKQPKLAAELQAQIDSAPKTPRGKLEQWHLIGAPQIHHRLSKFARFAPDKPWLVTHAVAGDPGEDPVLWGIDCEALPQELSRLEGLTVVVELPRPVALGQARLGEDEFNYIPIFEPGDTIPDPDERLRELAIYLLAGIPKALGKDIEGATLEIRISG